MYTASGTFTPAEGMVGASPVAGACADDPQSNCSLVDWTATSAQMRTVQSIDVGKEPGLADVFAHLIPDSSSGTDVTMDLCFTPLGRSFVRYANAGPFTPMTGVPQFQVFRGSNLTTPDAAARVRTVILLPTGVARLSL